jgi:hypothetical protein
MECVKYDCTLDDGGDYSRLCLHHWCEQHNLICECNEYSAYHKSQLYLKGFVDPPPDFHVPKTFTDYDPLAEDDEKDAKDDELEFDYPTWKEQMEDGTLEYVTTTWKKSLENQDD